ncbi:MAG TPA: efflux RND transporter periplasmic adaptor subunit [Terriglobia bacterium]|nr:efflux RND transporter periplasmic adaptor subunit [Terriglobia bacterium]
MRKLLILVLIAGAAGAGLYYLYGRPVTTLALTGIVTTDDVVLSSQVQGQIQQMLVKEGDPVKSGQLLATIVPQELAAQRAYYAHAEEGQAASVASARSALQYQELQTRNQIDQAQASLASAEAQQKEAAADLENDQLNYQRTHSLFQQGIVPASSDDTARTTLDAAQAHLQALKQQVDAARAAVELARSNLEQVRVRENELAASMHQLAAAGAQKTEAQVRLGYTEIRSPLDGFVDTRAALQGEVVNVAQPILTLINPDNLWVRIDVPETYIDRIRLGEQLPVRLPSGEERAGTVFYRGADASFATQRDVSRTKRDIKTFEVRLRVDNPDRALAVGMSAYVTVPIGNAK